MPFFLTLSALKALWDCKPLPFLSKCPLRGLERIEEFLTSKPPQFFHKRAEIWPSPPRGCLVVMWSRKIGAITETSTAAIGLIPFLATWKHRSGHLPRLCKFSCQPGREEFSRSALQRWIICLLSCLSASTPRLFFTNNAVKLPHLDDCSKFWALPK